MICVELVAVDCMSAFNGALFRGSVSHEALKGVFEAKVELCALFSLLLSAHYTLFEVRVFPLCCLVCIVPCLL